MKLLLEVLHELFSMFWADAGLCLGCLAAVATAGIGLQAGLLDNTAALAVLVAGTAVNLAANVRRAQTRLRR